MECQYAYPYRYTKEDCTKHIDLKGPSADLLTSNTDEPWDNTAPIACLSGEGFFQAKD
jgi:hypothetical protein